MTSVLLIDDDVEIRELLHQVLVSLGYDARTTETGAQGLDAFRASPADVVLLDMFMPDRDGLETLRDLRRINPNVRVIAMTGGGTYKNVGILKPALLLGARKLLYKPVTPTELRDAIEEVMAAPR